jgi:hypothetical protein
MASDEQIEREIQAKGLTAPRVTLASIEERIASEWYFSAESGVLGVRAFDADSETPVSEIDMEGIPDALGLLTFCVLVLDNGFTIVGQSATASAANFDAELGQKIARTDALNKIWPLEGYLLRERLHQAGGELIGGSAESHAVYKFAGWLTSRDQEITASGHSDAAPMAQAVAEYLNRGERIEPTDLSMGNDVMTKPNG